MTLGVKAIGGHDQRQRPIDSLVDIHTGIDRSGAVWLGDNVDFFQRGAPKPVVLDTQETTSGDLADLLGISTRVQPIGTGFTDDPVDELPLVTVVCRPSIPERGPELVHRRRTSGAVQPGGSGIAGIEHEAIDDADAGCIEEPRRGRRGDGVAPGGMAYHEGVGEVELIADGPEVAPVLLGVRRVRRRLTVAPHIDGHQVAVLDEVSGYRDPCRTVMAATVHQQDVSSSATKVNPGDVAALPDQLDRFAAHSHMLCVRLPTGSILWLSATCLRVVEGSPVTHPHAGAGGAVLGALSAPSSTPGLLRRPPTALLSNSATAESITNHETRSGRIAS